MRRPRSEKKAKDSTVVHVLTPAEFLAAMKLGRGDQTALCDFCNRSHDPATRDRQIQLLSLSPASLEFAVGLLSQPALQGRMDPLVRVLRAQYE